MQTIINEVLAEIKRADEIYPRYHSQHEGYAVLLEEVEELWDAIKMKQSHPSRDECIRLESIQVAASILRFIDTFYNHGIEKT